MAVTTQGLQLLLPDGLSASAVADTLAGEVPIVTERSHAIERVFWDTFDGRVHGAGLVLAASGGRLTLSDAATSAERAGDTLKRGAVRLLASALPAGPLREQLGPVIEMRAVTPIVKVRSRLLPVNVLDDIGKIVVRLRVEEAAVVAGEQRIALRARLQLIPVLGYDREFAEIRTLLSTVLGLAEAARPVQDDAVEAVGGVIGGVTSKLRLELSPDDRADAAAVAILRRLHEVIELNMPGTLADIDSEFLHDLRVAVRRTRALQRELRGVFAPEPLRVFRDGFKELQRVTGPTRDLDVQLLEFDELAAGLPDGVAGDVGPLLRLLEDHLAAERKAMVRELRSDHTRLLLANWSDFLDRLVGSDVGGGPEAARPVADVAGARISRVYRRMVKMGTAIDDGTHPEALHELRKQGKELRYLLEFFSSLYPSAVVKPMVSSLKGLQDVLGRFQDREVQAELLHALGDEISRLQGGAAALMAMGVLVQRLHEDQRRARAEFAESFAGFAAKSQRKLVDQTFG